MLIVVVNYGCQLWLAPMVVNLTMVVLRLLWLELVWSSMNGELFMIVMILIGMTIMTVATIDEYDYP